MRMEKTRWPSSPFILLRFVMINFLSMESPQGKYSLFFACVICYNLWHIYWMRGGKAMTFDLDLFPGNFGIDCMYDGKKKFRGTIDTLLL